MPLKRLAVLGSTGSIGVTTLDLVARFPDRFAEGQPAADLEARLAGALDRIRRRLGGLRHAAIRSALAEGLRTGAHRTWIRALLEQYYDPMYDYQLEAKRARIAFAGPGADVAAWLDAHDA
jgi:tRNA 2-selenouridine synthase